MSKNLSNLFSQFFILVFLSLIIIITFVSFIFPRDVYSLKIKLTWNKNKEGKIISGYRMFCREKGQNYNYYEPVWEGTETACTISNLDPNKTYYFVVRAFNTLKNESGNSNEVRYQRLKNRPPKAFDQSLTTQENKSLNITLSAVDSDGEHLTYSLIDQPLHGNLSGIPPSITYLPNPNYNGSDYFTFSVNDGKVDSNIAIIKIFIDPADDPPIVHAGLDQNNIPSAPALNYPHNNAEIDNLEITLSVSNSTDVELVKTVKDPGGQTLTYTFEIYSDQDLNFLVTSVSGIQEEENTTSWHVDILLEDNSFYYWRARVFNGIVYSEWMDTAKFFINTSNDAPSIPSISSPPDKSGVWTLQPTLEVNNAEDKDLDPLNYVFEVYHDQNMNILTCTKTVLIEGKTGTTSWQINTPLVDNTFYWWRVRAMDNENESSGWTNPSQFFVNTSNDAPSIPTINSPKNTQEVDTLFPVLKVNNSLDIDPDQEKLIYFFEIYKTNNFATSFLEKSPQVLEYENITSWAPFQLDDNSFYHWRARAYDREAYSLWAVGSFFVNLANDPPTTPTIKNPGNNAKVSTSTPIFMVNPSTDVDFDQLAYEFEFYFDSNLSDLATAINSTETSCRVGGNLKNNRRYYWRVRAVDEHEAASEWSDIVSFWVDVKHRPTPPSINNPVSGGTVTSLTPTLSINNSIDEDNEELYYRFELFSDKDLSVKEASSTKISQKDIITSWHVSYPLSDNTIYYWRVRASDGKLTSKWMPTAMFVVDISGADIIMDLESSQDVSAAAQTAQKIEVINNDSPINAVSLEIPPGALSNDCTITIGLIANPPALPDNTKAIGKVIEFGPSGITFSKYISIMIPYCQTDLDNAGINDPSRLEVFTYNTSALLWEKIQVYYVDRENSLLIFKTDHFSMFTTGISVEAVQQEDDARHLEFIGNCFIESITLNSNQMNLKDPF